MDKASNGLDVIIETLPVDYDINSYLALQILTLEKKRQATKKGPA